MAYVSLTSLSQLSIEMGDRGGGGPPLPQHILSGRSVGQSVQTAAASSAGGLGGYAVGPEPWDAGWAGGCVVPWGCVVAGGEPVCSWAWNWASCSGLASVFSRLFSCSSWEFFSISSLICSLRTSTSSLTAYIKWLFTRSIACSILLSIATTLAPEELLSSLTEAFSVPSKDDKKEIEKCLSW